MRSSLVDVAIIRRRQSRRRQACVSGARRSARRRTLPRARRRQRRKRCEPVTPRWRCGGAVALVRSSPSVYAAVAGALRCPFWRVPPRGQLTVPCIPTVLKVPGQGNLHKSGSMCGRCLNRRRSGRPRTASGARRRRPARPRASAPSACAWRMTSRCPRLHPFVRASPRHDAHGLHCRTCSPGHLPNTGTCCCCPSGASNPRSPCIARRCTSIP